jgi:serine/threonine-protein kinase
MEGRAVGRRWYLFGPYRLDPAASLVVRHDKQLPLTPKAVETLRVLVQSSGSMVSKETLLNEVWPGSFVGDGSLMRNISDLRKVLGRDARGDQYIETVPKRGYRFVSPVKELEEDDPLHRRTIAILPLKLLSGSPRDNCIGLGIADAVITKLSAIRECIVRPTTVVSEYLRSQEDPAAIGRQLGVEFVLDGTVRRLGDRMRVTVRLVATARQTPVWAETFEEKFADILSFEESISEELAGALALSLSTEQRKLLTKRYTENAAAYQLYLRGRFHWGKRSQEGLRQAIQHFNRAIEIDAEYPLAYSALASSYALVPMLCPVPSSKFLPKAKAAAITALDIDDTLVEARSALAFVKWHYDWDWEGAKREFQRILKFQPHDPVTRQWYGLLLVEQGEFSAAIAQARKAQSIDPVSVSIRGNLATVLHFAGRYDEAMEEARRTLAMDPGSFRAQWILGLALEQKGDLQEAVKQLEKASQMSRRVPVALGALGHAYAAAGRADQATRVLKDLMGHVPEVCSYAKSVISLGLGNKNQALEWLDKACDDKEFYVVTLKVDKRFGDLRSSARFRSILQRVRLVE